MELLTAKELVEDSDNYPIKMRKGIWVYTKQEDGLYSDLKSIKNPKRTFRDLINSGYKPWQD